MGSSLLSIAHRSLQFPHLPLSWMLLATPSPEGAPFCDSCWFPFIHHQGPEALTRAAGVLPAGPLRPGSLGSSTLNKRTPAGDQLQLWKLPLVLYFLFTILGCVGLTVCLLELLSNKRKDGCGDGRQSYTSLWSHPAPGGVTEGPVEFAVTRSARPLARRPHLGQGGRGRATEPGSLWVCGFWEHKVWFIGFLSNPLLLAGSPLCKHHCCPPRCPSENSRCLIWPLPPPLYPTGNYTCTPAYCFRTTLKSIHFSPLPRLPASRDKRTLLPVKLVFTNRTAVWMPGYPRWQPERISSMQRSRGWSVTDRSRGEFRLPGPRSSPAGDMSRLHICLHSLLLRARLSERRNHCLCVGGDPPCWIMVFCLLIYILILPALNGRQQDISQAPAGPHIPAFHKLASARSTQNSFRASEANRKYTRWSTSSKERTLQESNT